MYEQQEPDDIQERKKIQDDITEHGCHLIMIPADNYLPGFAYSIGLHERFGHPELIIFGLDIDLMASLLNDACAMIKNGIKLRPITLYAGFLENYDVQFIDVDKGYYLNYIGYATWYYGNGDFPVLQMLWPDKQQKFPWEEDFNPAWKFKQPMLDRNIRFKFYEERSLAVFTTKDTFEGAPILYVYHDEDREWQFHTSDQVDPATHIIVSLEQITRLDPSINEIFHLPFGGRAWRSSPDEKWEWEYKPDN